MKTLKLKSLLAGTAFAMLLATAAVSPAKADWDDHRDHGDRGHHQEEWRHERWEDHEQREWEWHRYHPHYVAGYVYTPPPVVYYPPPPPTGINLILPLHFD